MELEALKKEAALKALEQVKSGMLVGLGTGSTAKHFITALGAKLKHGDLTAITAVATSVSSEEQALGLGINLVPLTGQTLDLAVDGMDEVDPKLNVIKGLGGALTREKIVESCAAQFILIGDETKTVNHLGEKTPLPVEVVQFAWKATAKKLSALGLAPKLRHQEDVPFVTDNGNYILDCHMQLPLDVHALAQNISMTPGVLEHGLFLDMASLAYIATSTELKVLEKA